MVQHLVIKALGRNMVLKGGGEKERGRWEKGGGGGQMEGRHRNRREPDEVETWD